MTTSNLRWVHLLILLNLWIHWAEFPALAQDHDNQSFIYNGFKGANNLHLEGNAQIHPNGLLQLTNTSDQQIGRAFYQIPISFNRTSLSFSTTFVFSIVPAFPDHGGHGIAFTLSPSLNFNHSAGNHYLGLLNSESNNLTSNHLLAVELDTVKNPDFNDINKNHIGIDINSLNSTASAPVTYSDSEGRNKSLELVSGKAMQIWIDYEYEEEEEGVKNLLNVTIAPFKSPKPDQTLLSITINLSSVFLDSMYVGFSSAAGIVASNHYILGWSFNRSGLAQGLEHSKLPSFPHQRRPGEKPGPEYTVPLATVSVVLVITVLGIVYYVRRKKFEEIHEDWEKDYGPQRFSYKDLYKATKGFKDRELLGSGGFGKVYKGVLPSSKEEIAVKKVSHDSKQGIKEFVTEVASMGRLRHRNLVQLLGYCRRKGELLLVYDYMPNGSLDKFLFGNKKPTLNWAQRHRILKGVASGLLYLHEEWEQVVLHRDVKSSNVLLDDDLNGRLGDFGLARLYDHGANPETTHVVGTVGYLAPELTKTGKATPKTDVFAFGAFLLEVACGKRPIDQQTGGLPEDMSLADWVFSSWKQGAILETSDPRLGGDYPGDEMELVLKLGLICSQSNPAARPSMRQVIQYLNGDVLLPEMVLQTAAIGSLGLGIGEESSEFGLSFPSSSMAHSANSYSSNTDSILTSGR